MDALVWFHRWVSVAMCVMFAAWFATGAMMVFVAFPSLPPTARAAQSDPIASDRIALSPQDLAARAPELSGLRLRSRLGEPVYLGVEQGHAVAYSARDGRAVPRVTAAEATQIASAFGKAPARLIGGPFDYDQWIVHQQFDAQRPFYRLRLDAPGGVDLWVSARTGEVVQQATAVERAANWAGSIIHWVYYVPLRRSFAAWDWTVWCGSVVGLLSVGAGLWLGLRATLRKQRSQAPGLTPFKGIMQWHHLLGLTAGVFVLVWITSGWLSMDHGRLFSTGEPGDVAADAYSGPVEGRLSLDDVRRVAAGLSEVTFTRVAGCDIAAARGRESRRTVAACLTDTTIAADVPQTLIQRGLAAAWPNARLQVLEALEGNAPYAKAEGVEAGTIQARLQGEGPDRVLIDSGSGKILVAMDRSRIAYAWVYYMAHTYNYPGLSNRPVLRIAILLIPLTLGFLFSVTGVIVGVRRLTGKAAGIWVTG